MTKNQIDYWNYVESNRHNLATERETRRANQERELETNRSNLANENLKAKQLAETIRINTINANEAQRANRAREDLSAQSNVLEGQRVLVSEAALENQRSIAQIQAAASRYASDTSLQAAMISDTTRQRELIEKQRSNLSNESISRTNASSSQRNSVVAQSRLNFDREQYETTGKALQRSQATENASATALNLNTAKRQNVQNAADVNNSLTRTFSANTNAANQIINPLIGAVSNSLRLLGGTN